MAVNKGARRIKNAKIWVNCINTGKNLGKDRCKSTKISKIWEEMGNLIPVEPKHIENYGTRNP